MSSVSLLKLWQIILYILEIIMIPTWGNLDFWFRNTHCSPTSQHGPKVLPHPLPLGLALGLVFPMWRQWGWVTNSWKLLCNWLPVMYPCQHPGMNMAVLTFQTRGKGERHTSRAENLQLSSIQASLSSGTSASQPRAAHPPGLLPYAVEVVWVFVTACVGHG